MRVYDPFMQFGKRNYVTAGNFILCPWNSIVGYMESGNMHDFALSWGLSFNGAYCLRWWCDPFDAKLVHKPMHSDHYKQLWVTHGMKWNRIYKKISFKYHLKNVGYFVHISMCRWSYNFVTAYMAQCTLHILQCGISWHCTQCTSFWDLTSPTFVAIFGDKDGPQGCNIFRAPAYRSIGSLDPMCERPFLRSQLKPTLNPCCKPYWSLVLPLLSS